MGNGLDTLSSIGDEIGDSLEKYTDNIDWIQDPKYLDFRKTLNAVVEKIAKHKESGQFDKEYQNYGKKLLFYLEKGLQTSSSLSMDLNSMEEDFDKYQENNKDK